VAKPSAKLYVAPKTAVTVTAQPASKPILVPSTAPSVVPKVVVPLVTLVPSKPLAQELPLPASDQRVVEQLLTEADQLKAQGKVTQAVIQLQRAQRIAPREPKVYARLAALQLSLGEASRAEQLALKGLTLVPNKSSYQYYFWKLIGASRSHLGDSAGETKAIAEAAKYK
jgi:predicted Zn-dependent protease